MDDNTKTPDNKEGNISMKSTGRTRARSIFGRKKAAT